MSCAKAIINPAPNACPFTAQIDGTEKVMILPMSAINSFVNAALSSEGADEIQSKSSPFEKNLLSDEEVTRAAGPCDCSTSSNAVSISLTS